MAPDPGSHTKTHLANNSAAAGFVFDNTYARELEGFYVPWKAAQVVRPSLAKFNRELAQELGLDADALDSEEGARIFAGNEVPEGAAPLAQMYAGHQFGGPLRNQLYRQQAPPNTPLQAKELSTTIYWTVVQRWVRTAEYYLEVKLGSPFIWKPYKQKLGSQLPASFSEVIGLL